MKGRTFMTGGAGAIRLARSAAAIFYGVALTALGLVPVHAADDWRAVTDIDLSVAPGSALDLSFLVELGPAGRHGRVVIRSDGHFVFEKRMDQPRRFLCASQPYGIEGGFPDHASADHYAYQLRLHGYNLARFTFVDTVLMTGRTGDFDFDPIQLDRFYYFLAALKRHGIYWMLDALSSWNGAYGDVGNDRWANRRNVKAGIYYDPAQQAHWKELVRRVLAARNRYTGLRMLDDPALMGLILVNEGGLNFLIHLAPSAEMNKLFETWLKRKYGLMDGARKAWGLGRLPSDSTELPRRVWTASPKMSDVQRFYHELQTTTAEWMTQYLRELGYVGPVTAYDNWPHLQDDATRGKLPWVDSHFYHDPPSEFVAPGSQIKQTSSLEDGLDYLRRASAARYWGKPYTVSEYDQPFWNRWRYESGLAAGAMAAFQDWDLICRHASGPIELSYGRSGSSRRKAIYPFGAGMDPVARAGETLAALLFLRGDVRTSMHRIGVRLTPEYVFDQQSGIGKTPDDVTRLSLLTGLGLIWKEPPSQPKVDWVVDPGGAALTLANKVTAKIGFGQDSRLAAWIGDLRNLGVLVDNNSDGKSFFASDTGEVTLDAASRLLKLITPRTEAVAFASAPGRLNTLSVDSASDPALVSASSLDGAALDRSHRILLVLASDARNSGMQFSNSDETELVRLGGMPVLMRNIRVVLVLRHADPTALSLYALRLNGERAERLPVNILDESSVAFVLDTGVLHSGPTTFFELAAE